MVRQVQQRVDRPPGELRRVVPAHVVLLDPDPRRQLAGVEVLPDAVAPLVPEVASGLLAGVPDLCGQPVRPRVRDGLQRRLVQVRELLDRQQIPVGERDTVVAIERVGFRGASDVLPVVFADAFDGIPVEVEEVVVQCGFDVVPAEVCAFLEFTSLEFADHLPAGRRALAECIGERILALDGRFEVVDARFSCLAGLVCCLEVSFEVVDAGCLPFDSRFEGGEPCFERFAVGHRRSPPGMVGVYVAGATGLRATVDLQGDATRRAGR